MGLFRLPTTGLFYLIVTMLLLISLGLLSFASTLSDTGPAPSMVMR
jgi:hypothetical protein